MKTAFAALQILALLTFASSSLAVAAESAEISWSHQCGTSKADSIDYRWCIDAADQRPHPHVLYYLHGYLDNAATWAQGLAPAAHHLIEADPALAVISISLGDAWLLTNVPHDDGRSNLFGAFVDHILPDIESRLGSKVSLRDLRGDSMGGFNASQLFFKRTDLFRRFALVCPIVLPFGPRASSAELDNYFRMAPAADKNQVTGLLDWFRWEFPTDPIWSEHDALELPVPKLSGAQRVYISAGNSDQYGYNVGAQLLASRLAQAGLATEWHAQIGGHCVRDEDGLNRFFSAP